MFAGVYSKGGLFDKLSNNKSLENTLSKSDLHEESKQVKEANFKPASTLGGIGMFNKGGSSNIFGAAPTENMQLENKPTENKPLFSNFSDSKNNNSIPNPFSPPVPPSKPGFGIPQPKPLDTKNSVKPNFGIFGSLTNSNSVFTPASRDSEEQKK